MRTCSTSLLTEVIHRAVPFTWPASFLVICRGKVKSNNGNENKLNTKWSDIIRSTESYSLTFLVESIFKMDPNVHVMLALM